MAQPRGSTGKSPRQPFSLKRLFGLIGLEGFRSDGETKGIAVENDGTVKEQLYLKDPDDGTQVAWSADKDGVDKGAAHVKLKSVEGPSEAEKVVALTVSMGVLKEVAFQLSLITEVDVDFHRFGD